MISFIIFRRNYKYTHLTCVPRHARVIGRHSTLLVYLYTLRVLRPSLICFYLNDMHDSEIKRIKKKKRLYTLRYSRNVINTPLVPPSRTVEF